MDRYSRGRFVGLGADKRSCLESARRELWYEGKGKLTGEAVKRWLERQGCEFGSGTVFLGRMRVVGLHQNRKRWLEVFGLTLDDVPMGCSYVNPWAEGLGADKHSRGPAPAAVCSAAKARLPRLVKSRRELWSPQEVTRREQEEEEEAARPERPDPVVVAVVSPLQDQARAPGGGDLDVGKALEEVAVAEVDVAELPLPGKDAGEVFVAVGTAAFDGGHFVRGKGADVRVEG